MSKLAIAKLNRVLRKLEALKEDYENDENYFGITAEDMSDLHKDVEKVIDLLKDFQ
jgi:hypothetical protein